MPNISKTSFWILFALTATMAATLRSYINGDGVEYLIMAHAFATHGSSSLTAADFTHVAGLLNGQMDPAAHKTLVEAAGHLNRTDPAVPYFGFARSNSGEIYSIHFWLYSMMAAPYYAVTSWLGIKPTLSFSLLNLTLLWAAIMHLNRSLPNATRSAALALLALGTAYYLRWTGPEVMAACCAFAASLSVLRRDTSMAILLCGIGATQNPSLALFIPLCVAHRVVAVKIPAIVTLPAVRRPALAELGLAGAGIVAALSPYVFYYTVFGIPSLIAPYFTDTSFITPRRLISFLADLDQGLLVGIPGLLIGLTGAAVAISSRSRHAAALNGLFFLLACAILAAPTLAAMNWNSGASVMLRYAYWTAMPLVAFLVSTFPVMAPTARKFVVSALIVAQCFAVLGSGLMLRATSHVHHTPLAEWALATFPDWVNPDPEIFIERGKQNEALITLKTTQVFSAGAEPVKLLRHWTNIDDNAGLCPPGQYVGAASVVDVDRGWQYLNGPFTCFAGGERTSMYLSFAQTTASRAALDIGWAGTEEGGTWTNAKRSVIRVPVPSGSEVSELHFTGQYFGPLRTSEVRINGHAIGRLSLANQTVNVPAGSPGHELVIELLHADAISPKQLGLSEDTRMLAYYLNGVHLRMRPRQAVNLRAGSQVGSPRRPM